VAVFKLPEVLRKMFPGHPNVGASNRAFQLVPETLKRVHVNVAASVFLGHVVNGVVDVAKFGKDAVPARASLGQNRPDIIPLARLGFREPNTGHRTRLPRRPFSCGHHAEGAMTRKSSPGSRPEDPKPYPSDRANYTIADVDRIVATAGGLPDGRVWRQLRPLFYPLSESDPSKWRWMSRRRALDIQLRLAAQEWASGSPKESTPLQMKKEFDRIEAAAMRLLSALHVGEDGEIERMPPQFRSLQGAAMDEAGMIVEGTEPPADDLLQETAVVPENEPATSVEKFGVAFEAFRVQAKRDWAMDEARATAAKNLFRETVAGVVRLRRWAKAARQEAVENMAWEEETRARVKQSDQPSPDDIEALDPNPALTELFHEIADIWIGVFERKVRTSVSVTRKPAGPFVRFIQACLGPLGIELTDEAVRDRVRVLFQGKRMGKFRRQIF
jgi:hypothetical protein